MATSVSRNRILSIFKTLHRTRQHVFGEDLNAQIIVRQKINEEFHKHRLEKNPEEIKKLVDIAEEANVILKTKVVQAELVKPNIYQIRSDQIKDKLCDNNERCDNCTCGYYDNLQKSQS